METKIWRVSATRPEPAIIKAAARLIQQGELVAFPTETVYGLGANGLNDQAVRKIFQVKGRPLNKPLILHIGDLLMADQLAVIEDERVRELMDCFWPGPLTLVLPKKEGIPVAVTAGLPSVALRMPRHPVALALLRECGLPLAAPSANLSGLSSPTTGADVYRDLGGRIPMILDSGFTGGGLASTILDLCGGTPLILRCGDISREDLVPILGPVEVKK